MKGKISKRRPSGPVVFIRVGWLEFYDGERDGNRRPIGGGSFNDVEKGSEVENFRPIKNMLFGYGQVPRGGGYNALRLGLNPDRRGAMREGTVIMIAKEPNDGGQRVVGWYKNATFYDKSRDRPARVYGVYNFSAPVSSAVLLPVSRRTELVPRGRGRPGTSNVFYSLDSNGRPRRDPWIEHILEHIESYEGPNLLLDEDDDESDDDEPDDDETVHPVRARGQGRGLNSVERRAVELEAMKRAKQYFIDIGYRVIDVTTQHLPYDLCCEQKGEPTLYVEVKGTTGSGSSVIVTAKEVNFALSHDNTALFILSKIKLLDRGGQSQASGGTPKCIRPWKPRESDLRATQYEYQVPTQRKG